MLYEVITMLDEYIQHARIMNSNGELIRLLSLQAVVFDALGDSVSAHVALHEALVLGAPEGYIWRAGVVSWGWIGCRFFS